MKLPIVYGIAAGIVYSLYFFVDYLLGYQTGKFNIGVLTSITIFIVPLMTAYLGTKRHLARQSDPDFAEGLKATVTIVLIGGAIATLYSWWHINHFTPDYVETAKAYIQAFAKESGATPQDIAQALSKTEARFNLSRRLITCGVGFLVTGIPAGLAATWIYLRRNVQEDLNA